MSSAACPAITTGNGGVYFITFCTKNSESVLGDIPAGAVGWPPDNTTGIQLNDIIRIVDEELKKIQIIRGEIILDQ